MTILLEIAHVRGSAVLAVTHDIRVMPFADRIIYIEDGSLTDNEPAIASVYPHATEQAKLHVAEV